MTTLAPSPDHTRVRATTATPRITFAGTVRAEWIKFRSLRSTVWTLLTILVLMVGTSVLVAWGMTVELGDATAPAGALNLAMVLGAGYQLAQLGVAVLGVLIITSEYSTGMVRSTFTAVPRRLPVLAAKALVLSVAIVAVTVISILLSALATMPFHHRLGATFDLTDGETLRMTIGLPLYLTAIGLLAFALGALVRHSAGALTTIIALLLVIENVLMIIPLRAVELISPFLPSTAGRRLLFDSDMLASTDAGSTAAHLGPWEGYAVLIAWAVALVALAAVRLRRADA